MLKRPQAPHTLAQSTYLTQAPAAVGEIIDALETLTHLNDYGPTSILRGRSVEDGPRYIPVILRRGLDTQYGVGVLKSASLAGAVLVLTGRGSRKRQIAGSMLLFAARRLGEIRSPYGRDGSDQMNGLISGYRVMTALVPDAQRSDDLFLRAVNAQTCLSYLQSGVAKLFGASWVSGEAVERILRTRQYGNSAISRFIQQRPPLSKALTWSTIVWECSFPVIYTLSPAQARTTLHGVRAFHLGIAAAMGLPRFVWGFSSAHASIMYVIEKKAAR